MKESSEHSVLISAGCTQSRKNKWKTFFPSQSVYISLQPSLTSPHTEHKLRRLRGFLVRTQDDDNLFDMINDEKVYIYMVFGKIFYLQ